MNKGKYLKYIEHYEFSNTDEAKEFADELIQSGYCLFYEDCGFDNNPFVSIVQYELIEERQ